jgi:hypothetical protein
MIRRIQILLAYIGLAVIVFHGVIPHHHHETELASDCISFTHAETNHVCNIDNHKQAPISEFICHFKVITYKFSVDKQFIPEKQIQLNDSKVICTDFTYQYIVSFSSNTYYNSCSLRAPPTLS